MLSSSTSQTPRGETPPALRYFGTDGIRGQYGSFPVDRDGFRALGRAFGCVARFRSIPVRIVVGRDTRTSSTALEAAVIEGLTAAGVLVTSVGVVPSSAVSFLTKHLRADGGVIITASHNPAADNGAKFFGPDGSKISAFDEQQLEGLAFQGAHSVVPPAPPAGISTSMPSLTEHYVRWFRDSISPDVDLSGMRLAVDCSNGAASAFAAAVFGTLGVDVVVLSADPDGYNINDGVGAVHPELLAAATQALGCDLGLALDGDADRAVFADEQGQVVDGEQVLGALALDAHTRGALPNATVVGTVLTNRGLEARLESQGIRLVRANVGDRNVYQQMVETGANVGGEGSGHYIFRECLPVSDGLLTCLKLFSAIAHRKTRASELLNNFVPTPQVAINLPLGAPLTEVQLDDCSALADETRLELGGQGTVVLRPSGTEPLLRVTVDADTPQMANRSATRLAKRVRTVLRDSSDPAND